MIIKQLSRFFLILIISNLLFVNCSTPDEENESPNILFLFTDDQRFSTLNAWGYSEIITPNMDRLVDMGLSFTHAHIMGGTSGAVCMPSRAMLMTSKTLFHLEKKGADIPLEHKMMPEVLKENGYVTFGTGKWHNGKKTYARSFTDGGKIFFGGMSDHLKVPVFDFDTTRNYPEDKKYLADKFSSELFADEAIGFIQEYNEKAPFFLYVSFTSPHDPRMAPKEYEDLYPRGLIKVPENFLPIHPFDNGEMRVRDEKLAPWPRTHQIVQDNIGGYYAMITHLDAQIGRILDALERSGKAENTIIVFAGDNGLAVGQHGLLGKQNLYEHSIRVPLIIAGPGIPVGKESAALCYLNDIFPTLCDITGIPQPVSIEGISLSPLIENQQSELRNEVFYAYRNFQRGIRTSDNWKLIKYNVKNADTTQLFNLNTDPWEINNLAADERYKPILNKLTDQLDEYMKSIDDPMDIEKENWGKEEVIIPPGKTEHKGKGKNVKMLSEWSKKYPGGGKKGLTDGNHGLLEVGHPAWQGYEGTDFKAMIDLGEEMNIGYLSSRYLHDVDSWVFLPQEVQYSVSVDGNLWTPIGIVKPNIPLKTNNILFQDFGLEFKSQPVKFVKVEAKNVGVCPTWHPGAGGKAWIFVDEVIVK